MGLPRRPESDDHGRRAKPPDQTRAKRAGAASSRKWPGAFADRDRNRRPRRRRMQQRHADAQAPLRTLRPGRASRSHGADEPGDDRGTEALAPPFDRRAAPLHDRLGRTDVVPAPRMRGAIRNHALVRSTPGSGRVVATLGRLDENGLPTVVEVVGVRTGQNCRPTWYRVRLSVIPNGTVGWVRAYSLRLYRVTSRVVIDLSKRTLRLYRSGKLVLHTTVGIGASNTPTPVGRFFVNERYVVSPSTGPLRALRAWDLRHTRPCSNEPGWSKGPIALHGTNEPWSIGEAASHGCVHIANRVMQRVFSLTTDGTPVTIEA